MRCERARERMAESLAGALQTPAAGELDAHLAACEACAAEWVALRDLWDSLGRLPEEYPGPAMRERFDAMLAAYQAGIAQASLIRRPGLLEQLSAAWLRCWPRRPAWQFAAAMAVLAVGIGVGRFSAPDSATPPRRAGANTELARLRNEVHEMRQLVALSLLQQQSASQRLEGVNWSVRVEPNDTEVLSALLRTVNTDGNVNVRLAAVDALRYFGDSPVARRGLAQALSRQQSPLVQIALIDTISELRDRQALPEIRAILNHCSTDENVRQRAQAALVRISSSEPRPQDSRR